MQDGRHEVYNQLHQNQSQFIYLMLALNISAIGFAVNRTVDTGFEWFQLPLALAVICWSVSFYNGMRYLEIKLRSFTGNLWMYEQPENKVTLKDILEKYSKRGILMFKIMKIFFYFGVILFMTWHLIKMSSR